MKSATSKSYTDVVKQIEQLSKEAENLKRKEIAGVISRIREAIQTYSLTAADLGLAAGLAGEAPRGRKGVARAAGRGASAVKYRNSEGQVWGGRGPRPLWLRSAIANGHTLAEFAV